MTTENTISANSENSNAPMTFKQAIETATDRSNSGANVLKIADDAFKALESSQKLDGKGRQMLAYVIMRQHADDVADDRKPPALSTFRNSPKAAREYMGRLAELFIGKTPAVSKEQTDDLIRQRNTYRARYAHLSRAVTLASDLIAADVDSVSFDPKLGMFRLAPDVFCDPNMEPVGKLAKLTSVVVDGATYMVERGGKVVAINASLSRITDAAKAKRAKLHTSSNTSEQPANTNGASDTATNGGAKAEAVVQKIETFSMDALLVRAAKIANEPSDGPLLRSMLTDEAWNALNDLVAFYQEIEANEAKLATEQTAKAA